MTEHRSVILSGYPHLEELYWFGEGVLPVLEERGSWTRPEEVAEGMHTGSIRSGGVAFGVVPADPSPPSSPS